MKKLIYILLTIVLFGSCEKYIDIEIPDEGRKVTVNCFINDSDKPILMLTRSKFILDNSYDFTMIDSAKAYLYQNGVQVAEFFQQDTSNIPEPWDIGAYVADYTCQPGKQYTIKVIKDGETLTSNTQIPNKVSVQSIDTLSVQDQSGNRYLRVKITINDPSTQENFYQFAFRTISLGYENIIYFAVDQSDLGLTGPSYQSYMITNDKLFNGQTKTFIFDLDAGNFYDIVTPLSVVVNGVSKDMFLYYQQLQKYQNAQNSFLAEPVMMFTNIDNGLGIFAGYSSNITTIDVPSLIDDIIIEGKNKTHDHKK
jgi:hypothetical protein